MRGNRSFKAEWTLPFFMREAVHATVNEQSLGREKGRCELDADVVQRQSFECEGSVVDEWSQVQAR